MNDEVSSVTIALATTSSKLRFDTLPDDVVAMVKLCILDWFAVAIAGAAEPTVGIMLDEALERGAAGDSSVPGCASRLNLLDAALIGGTASHALDYDDGSAAMGGHPSVVIASALLPLAEFCRRDGRSTLAAFVAGYELAARVGLLVTPDHYAQGFHPTGTVGALSAAAACANLLQLSPQITAVALGIAATQAAGLIANFGTMCKPLHAGRAAANGLLAARLAARGFTGRSDMLETPYGFTHSHGTAPDLQSASQAPVHGFHILANVFKFHAACGGTHGVIEAARQLRDRGVEPNAIRKLVARVNPKFERICNIEQPCDGLELKFSYRAMIAAALLGLDTTAISLYTGETASRVDLVVVRDKVEVQFSDAMAQSCSELVVELLDGTIETAAFDTRSQLGSPTLQTRISAKFFSLVASVLGPTRAVLLHDRIVGLEQLEDAGELMHLAVSRRSDERATSG
ncbi:MmgE/PrpD family protein [Paraburkholderia phytofirmans]